MQLSRYINLVGMTGTSGQTTAAPTLEVDTADAEGVMFVGVGAGTTAARIWKMRLHAGATTTGFVACGSGTALDSTATGNYVLTTDVHKPAKRWVKATFSCSATTLSLGSLLAFKYGLRKPATTWSATASGIITLPACGLVKRVVSPTST
jgi:hypothetical protein